MSKSKTQGERLTLLIQQLGITPYQFSKDMGYKRPDSIYKLTNKQGNLSGKFLSKLKEIHPEVSMNWLLNGVGEMFTDKIKNEDFGAEPKISGPEVYPARLSYNGLKKLATAFSNCLWKYPEEELFKMEVRKAMTDGLELKITRYYKEEDQLVKDRVYSILIMPDWNISGFFDFWRVDMDSRRGQNLFELNPHSKAEFADLIKQFIHDLKKEDAEFNTAYLKDEEWMEV